MSYDTVEGLWLARLRAMQQFTPQNTARLKWGLLNSGASNHYAILKPGTHSREWVAFKAQQTVWQTVIQLWQRYKDDGTSGTDLVALIDAVLAELDTYPNLGDTGNTVQLARIIEIGAMNETPAGAPDWLYIELIGETYEQEAISFVE